MSFLNKFKARLEKAAEESLSSMGIEVVAEDQRIIRLELCNSCEHLFKPTRNCKKCGCFVDAKTRLQNSSCPIGKW